MLFGLPNLAGYYSPSADGKKLLMAAEPEGNAEASPLTVVVNWQAAVKK